LDLSRFLLCRFCPGEPGNVLFLRLRSQRRAHAGGVLGVYLGEMPKLTLDDVVRAATHRRGDVGEEPGLLVGVEKIEQGAGLNVIVVALAVVITIRIARNFQRRFGQFRPFDRTVE